MAPAPPPPSPAVTVRIIHLALTAGPVFVIVALWLAIGGRIVVQSLAGPAGYAAYVIAAAGFAFGFWWRSRIPSRAPGMGEIEYWRGTLPRAVVLWAALEAAVTVAAAVGILAGQTLVAVVALMIYLSLMLFSAPARLAGE